MADVQVSASMQHDVGVVAIGRNEGERLRRCLQSVLHEARAVVYVDSGSIDGSVAMAKSMGVEVVELDLTMPFTAARARNAGVERLRLHWPAIQFVQLVDGDCEVAPGWIRTAREFLCSHDRAAMACGRRRERFPQASVYNTLCDLEWDTPVGETKASGGDALVRIEAFAEVGGFNPSVIAGEEPELCVRLRERGWAIHRIDHEMTLHDAAMTRFGQWWKRTARAGHAFAQGSAMHGRGADRHWVRETRSAWFWGFTVWFLALAAAPWTYGGSVLLLMGYPVLFFRIYQSARQRGRTPRDARVLALFTTIGKLPQWVGVMTYWANRARGRTTRIMEYKSEPGSAH